MVHTTGICSCTYLCVSVDVEVRSGTHFSIDIDSVLAPSRFYDEYDKWFWLMQFL